MQPWSTALSACSGAWDALWLMKREGQGEGGAHSELKRRNNEQRCGWWKYWDNMSHTPWQVCVCLCEPDTPSCMVVAWCVLLCGNGVLLCCSILTLLAGNSIILTTESSILRHIGYCYQHKILTAAVISCFTLPKHSLHHICVTTVLITFDKGGYIHFLVPVLVTYSFYLGMLLQQVWRISTAMLILESSKWQHWAWESFRAHYHSLLNLLAGVPHDWADAAPA